MSDTLEQSPDELTEEAQLLLDVQARYEAARDHASKWRKEARDAYALYSGDQWSEDDIAKMTEQQRTPITFNRAGILIDAVIGYEVNNRQETRFIGRTQGDAKVNEQLTEAARYFRDQCDAEFEESDAFRDQAICGMGWTGDRLSDERRPEYDLVRDRVDPFEMYWDPSCKKPNLADQRYLFRKKWMDKSEAKALFPDWGGTFVQADWLGDEPEPDVEKTKNPRNSYRGDNSESSPTRDVPVLEYQYLESEVSHILVNPQTGQQIELQEEDWEALDAEKKAAIDQGIIPHKQQRRTVWKRCFLIGGEVVKQDQPFPHGPTYNCITGKRDRNKGYWFGLMKGLSDPQKWSNKFLAQIMHLINTSAKPGYDIEEGAVKNISTFESKAARPGALNTFVDGALQKGRVQRRDAQGLPPDLANLLEYANKSMSDVSGVNQELLGMADREQAGVLEYQRKQSAVTLLAPLFDSFRRYRKMAARTWLYFMQNYMTDGRLIRITQDQGDQGGKAEVNVPFTAEQFFDPNVAEYDVIIDQGASSPNLKEATWGAIQPLLPVIAERMGPEEMMLVLEYSPMPESFMEKLRAINAQKAQQPPPPDPAMMKVEADIKAKQADAQIKQQTAQQAMAMKQQEAQQAAQTAQQQAMLDAMLAKQEASQNMMIEKMRAQQDMQLEMMKAINEIRVNRMKAEDERQRAQEQFDNEQATSQVRTQFEIQNMNKMAKAKTKAISKGKPKDNK